MISYTLEQQLLVRETRRIFIHKEESLSLTIARNFAFKLPHKLIEKLLEEKLREVVQKFLTLAA